MKNILFYGILRPNRSPSQRFRIEQFFETLKKNNLSFDYHYLLDKKMDKALYAKGSYFQKLIIVLHCIFKLIFDSIFTVHKYEFVFVERELLMLGSPIFEKLFAKRSKLIYDFDDALWVLNMSEANKKLSCLKNPDKIRSIIKAAHTVVAGNEYLKNYALQFNERVKVIPTVLDTSFYKRTSPYKQKLNHKVCIGWSGSHTTIEHFKIILPVLKKLKTKYPETLYFKVIGDANFIYSPLNIQGLDWNFDTEIMELEEIDIGIMPLPIEPWSLGKCGLKGLVYMSMAIPNVMTNIGVNSSIVSDGENGFLCENEQQWVDKLDLLISNFDLRQKIGINGRKTVEERYSVNSVKKEFLQLFNH